MKFFKKKKFKKNLKKKRGWGFYLIISTKKTKKNKLKNNR